MILRGLALGMTGLGLLACVGPRGGWDLAVLSPYPAALAARESGSRLGDALPFLDLRGDRAELLLCRWPIEAPVRVSFPEDASDSEEDLIELALEAWEQAGLGIEFARSHPSAAQIELHFWDGANRSLTGRAALTVVTCQLEGLASPQLVHARIWLRRSETNVLEEAVPIAPAAFVGSALHELGHALGYNGHAALGSTSMVRDVQVVKELGRSLQDNGPAGYRDVTLRALYALPNGLRVGQRSLSPKSLEQLESLRQEVEHDPSWTGPYARASDRWARFFWLAPGGREVGVRVGDYANILRSGAALELEPIVPR